MEREGRDRPLYNTVPFFLPSGEKEEKSAVIFFFLPDCFFSNPFVCRFPSFLEVGGAGGKREVGKGL